MKENLCRGEKGQAKNENKQPKVCYATNIEK